MKQLQQIHAIAKSGFKIARIETDRSNTIINLFNEYCNKSNSHLFLWQNNNGLNRLSGQEMMIDNTRLLTKTIEYIDSAPDFGIYILKDFPSKYPVRISYQLQEILSRKNTCQCLIILLGRHLPLDTVLSQFVLTIQCASEESPVAAQADHRPTVGQQATQNHNFSSRAT